jgi:hypothetical protein
MSSVSTPITNPADIRVADCVNIPDWVAVFGLPTDKHRLGRSAIRDRGRPISQTVPETAR